jgi:hypothetical protein
VNWYERAARAILVILAVMGASIVLLLFAGMWQSFLDPAASGLLGERALQAVVTVGMTLVALVGAVMGAAYAVQSVRARYARPDRTRRRQSQRSG